MNSQGIVNLLVLGTECHSGMLLSLNIYISLNTHVFDDYNDLYYMY